MKIKLGAAIPKHALTATSMCLVIDSNDRLSYIRNSVQQYIDLVKKWSLSYSAFVN